MLPHVCDGLSVLWIAALCPFWRPCIGRPVHRELMRNELCNLTTIVPATACHQRNYVKPYSRYRLVVQINYPYRVVYVRFVGTHAEYDKIDVREV